MSNPVPGEVCTDDNANIDANDDAQRTIHDCKVLWLINQMSQKLPNKNKNKLKPTNVSSYETVQI